MPKIINYSTLYKKDSKGNIRFWKMERNGHQYRTVSGLVGGKETRSTWKEAKEKNVGKRTFQSAGEQATEKVLSAYRKKEGEGGYHRLLSDVEKGSSYVKPMLAKVYKSFPEDSQVFTQPKLDGIRCIAQMINGKIQLTTRKGKPIVSCPHIEKSLAVRITRPEVILDGELYSHELKSEFQQIVSLVRKQNTTPKILKETRVIEFHVYDIVMDASFEDRNKELNYVLFSEFSSSGLKGIRVVNTVELKDEDHADSWHETFLSQGYEGSILRISDKGYEHKRSSQLMKRKDFDDAEFTIIDILEGEGNRRDTAGKIQYEIGGKKFCSGIRGTKDFFRELLVRKDDYIGSEATVRYFGLTDAGIPRFPVTIDIHKGKRSD